MIQGNRGNFCECSWFSIDSELVYQKGLVLPRDEPPELDFHSDVQRHRQKNGVIVNGLVRSN
jgi:hypothetical protein